MWVETPTAFFALSQFEADRIDYRPPGYNPDLTYVQVRARVKDDLEDLRPYTTNFEVMTNPKADYAYRLVVPREEFAAYLFDAAMSIDYPSYKTSVFERARTLASERYHALDSAWRAFAELQDLRPYGRGKISVSG